MAQLLSCPHGHRWEFLIETSSPTSRQRVLCPICGGPATDTPSETRRDSAGLSNTAPYFTADRELAVRDGEGMPEPLPEIPGYEVLARIGSGGMGSVLKARDRTLGRLVALKLPLPKRMADEVDRNRFLREARSAAGLRHPNICPVHEVSEHQGQSYISMSYIDGQTLRHWAGQHRPNAHQAARIVAALARAVAYAHEHGVIHRDIKPGNVMIDGETGEPVLLDFGLAKDLAEESSQVTHSGDVVGTPAYMAPEQAAGHLDRVGPHSDIYALGAVLYELLCGRPPFEGTTGEILRKVQTDEPVALRKLAPRISRDLETICLKALARDPVHRYGSAAALADDLLRFGAGEAILARREPFASKLVRKVRRSPATAVSLLVVIVAIAVAGYFWSGASEARRVAVLTAQFHQQLDRNGWTVGHLEEMQEVLDDLEALAPEGAAEQRTRLQQRFAQFIRASVGSEDLAEIQTALDWLSMRDPELVPALRQALNERRRDWLVVFDSQEEDSPLAAVFDPAQVSRTADALERTGEAPAEADAGKASAQPTIGQTVYTRQPSDGDVELEVVFDESWDRASEIGLLLDATPGHTQPVTALAFSPDGRTLVSASAAELILWDLPSKVARVFKQFGEPGPISIAFSPEGKTLAVAIPSEQRVALLDPATGEEQRSLDQTCTCLGFSPDGRTLATGSEEVRLWDTDTWRVGARLAQKQVARLAFSPDGKTLASGSYGNTVKLWDTTSGEERFTLQGNANLRSMAFSPDSKALAVAGPQYVRLWDVASGQELHNRFQWGGLYCLSLSPDGKELALAAGVAGVSLWSVESLRPQRQVAVYRDYPKGNTSYLATAFSPDGQILAVGSNDHKVSLWEVDTGQQRLSLQEQGYGFVLRTPEVTGVSKHGGESVPADTIRAARQRRRSLRLQILRNGVLLVDQEVKATEVPRGPLTLLARREGNRLSFQISGLPPVEFYEVFSLSGAAGGVFALQWPGGVRLARTRALRQILPKSPSPLERGNELYARQQYAEALEYYREQVASEQAKQRPGEESTEMSQEARMKAAFCLLQPGLGRPQGAAKFFAEVATERGDHWPIVAGAQLWLMHLRQGRFEDADTVFATLSNRYTFAELAAMVPENLRRRIVDNYVGVLWGPAAFLPNPNVARDVERADQIEEFFQTPMPQRIGVKRSLVHAYQFAGRFDRALETAEDLVHNEQYWDQGPHPYAAMEYCWVLRHLGQPQRALAELDKLLFEPQGQYRRGHELLLVERARIHAALEQWEAAEEDIDEFFQLVTSREKFRPDYGYYSSACLMRGFLLERRGDGQRAMQVWREGLHENWRREMIEAQPNIPAASLSQSRGVAILHGLVLGSLTGELSDEEAKECIDRIFSATLSVAPRSGLAIGPKLVPGTPETLRAICRSPMSRDYARKIAFQELSLPELRGRVPVLLYGAAITRQGALPENFSPEQDALVWRTFEQIYHEYLNGKLQIPELLQMYATWRGNTGPLGWAGLRQKLDPSLRGPLAYIGGHRYLRVHQRTDDAIMFFRTALQDADSDSTLARLAQAELNRLAEGH